jgi:tetratricopeptide (TPR) repeat protein
VHPGDRTLNSEYGRLALELDQFSTAQKLLEQADDPAKPDWKTISARGTVLAKQGKYNDAIPLFERALAVSPGQPSVLNNLALARAMDGHADKAESLLRQAAASGSDDPKITQNLSLVLGLQGKYDEAKTTGQKALSADSAAEDVSYMRQMVKLEPRRSSPHEQVIEPMTLPPQNAVADAGQIATKKIATGSTTKRAPAKTAAAREAAPIDALAAVTALADGQANGPAAAKSSDAYKPQAK